MGYVTISVVVFVLISPFMIISIDEFDSHPTSASTHSTTGLAGGSSGTSHQDRLHFELRNKKRLTLYMCSLINFELKLLNLFLKFLIASRKCAFAKKKYFSLLKS